MAQVQVEGAPEHQGVRVDHPRLIEGVDTLLKKGYANEHIMRIIGVPAETVDRRRAFLRSQKKGAKKNVTV